MICRLLLLVIALASCSTAGRDAYDPVTCRTDNPCYVLDERLCACCPGGPAACEAELALSCARGELVLTPAAECSAALFALPDVDGCPIKAKPAALALICPTVSDVDAGGQDVSAPPDALDAVDAAPVDAADASSDATPDATP